MTIADSHRKDETHSIFDPSMSLFAGPPRAWDLRNRPFLPSRHVPGCILHICLYIQAHRKAVPPAQGSYLAKALWSICWLAKIACTTIATQRNMRPAYPIPYAQYNCRRRHVHRSKAARHPPYFEKSIAIQIHHARWKNAQGTAVSRFSDLFASIVRPYLHLKMVQSYLVTSIGFELAAG